MRVSVIAIKGLLLIFLYFYYLLSVLGTTLLY
jgi:hypothetical protein